MLRISTVKFAGFGITTYSVVIAENMDELRKKLHGIGQRSVSFCEKGKYDDSPSWYKSDVPVDEISEEDLAWLSGGNEYVSHYLCCGL